MSQLDIETINENTTMIDMELFGITPEHPSMLRILPVSPALGYPVD